MPAAADSRSLPWRKLRFESVAELREELDRILAAERSGRLRVTGNWTPGQILGHLAAWIEFGYVGFPMKPPPWIIRVLIRLKLKSYLRDGMPRGVRIPGIPEGTLATERIPTADAAARYRAALDRLEREPARFDSPAFGKVSDADRVALNLRHAELHLGYVQYDAQPA